MKTLRFKKDTEFNFYDYNQRFIHSRMTIKKDTLISIRDDELEIKEDIPGCEYDRAYFIEFIASEYDKENINIEIIQESENDTNDVEELRHTDCFLELNADDVYLMTTIDLLEQLRKMYDESDFIEDVFKGMTQDEFDEFEMEAFEEDDYFEHFDEYIQWVYDNFGAWG